MAGSSPTRRPAHAADLRLHAWKISYQNEAYDGEHEAVIDPDTFDRAQKLLQKNYRREQAVVHDSLSLTCSCRWDEWHLDFRKPLVQSDI